MDMDYKEKYEKLQKDYDELYEGHENLTREWVRLKKELKELHGDYDGLLEDYNKLDNAHGKLYQDYLELRDEVTNLVIERDELLLR